MDYTGSFMAALGGGRAPMAPAMAMAAGMGRGGDTMLGHLTPGEVVIPRGRMTPKLMAAFLEAMDGADPGEFVVGGAGNKRNPMTGAPEYFDRGDPESGAGDYGGLGMGEAPGSTDPSGGQRGDGGSDASYTDPLGYDRGAAEQSMLDVGVGGVGGYGTGVNTPGEERGNNLGDSLRDIYNRSPGEQMLGLREELTLDPETGRFGSMYTGATMNVPGTLASVFGGPLAGAAVGALSSRAGLGDITVPFGGYQRDAFGAIINRTPTATAMLDDEERGSDDRTTGAVDETITPAPGMPPLPGEEPRFVRPDEMAAPDYLELSPAMTDLQRRTRLATFGVAGNDSRFRGADAQALYRNILLRALVDDGRALGTLRLEPIERQFLGQMGIEAGDDMAALYAALTNPPARGPGARTARGAGREYNPLDEFYMDPRYAQTYPI